MCDTGVAPSTAVVGGQGAAIRPGHSRVTDDEHPTRPRSSHLHCHGGQHAPVRSAASFQLRRLLSSRPWHRIGCKPLMSVPRRLVNCQRAATVTIPLVPPCHECRVTFCLQLDADLFLRLDIPGRGRTARKWMRAYRTHLRLNKFQASSEALRRNSTSTPLRLLNPAMRLKTDSCVPHS